MHELVRQCFLHQKAALGLELALRLGLRFVISEVRSARAFWIAFWIDGHCLWTLCVDTVYERYILNYYERLQIVFSDWLGAEEFT